METKTITWKDVIHYTQAGNPTPPKRVEKTEAEWKAQLTDEQYYVTRQHGTERAGSGEFCSKFEPGLYACACCGTTLFDSGQKFESGTGWPSFTQPVEDDVIKYIADKSFGMVRVEVQCNVCDCHLGHVFPDGPAPTGLRYCVNSLSLSKV